MTPLRLLPLFLGALLLFQAGCQTVPETGRSQLIMISSREEAAMGLQAFQQIKRDEKISDDVELNLRIQRMGRRIAESVGRDMRHAEWEFIVFESDQINAFALPGGKVGIYTGLINLADSDDEIAAVIGHEVAHVTSRHGAERISQALLAGIGGIAVAVATNDSSNREGWVLGYTAVATLGTLGYSRLQELEADAVGVRFAAGAGYDPRAAITFWEKMKARKEGSRMPAFLSTHPSDDQRIARLREVAPRYLPLYEQARARYEADAGPE
jgi:metalloendopeptidase OMA1, mitochondrial